MNATLNVLDLLQSSRYSLFTPSRNMRMYSVRGATADWVAAYAVRDGGIMHADLSACMQFPRHSLTSELLQLVLASWHCSELTTTRKQRPSSLKYLYISLDSYLIITK
jgi:hypothetical protein